MNAVGATTNMTVSRISRLICKSNAASASRLLANIPTANSNGTVKLTGGLGGLSFACFAVPVHVQAAVVATPVIWFQTVQRSSITYR